MFGIGLLYTVIFFSKHDTVPLHSVQMVKAEMPLCSVTDAFQTR